MLRAAKKPLEKGRVPFMKKLIALIMTLVICMFSVSALCEAAQQSAEPTVIDIEVTYEGAELKIEPAAIGMLVPADWTAAEVTEEQAAQGLVYQCANPDGTVTLQVLCAQTEGQTMDSTYEALAATEGITDLSKAVINSIEYIGYSITQNNSACLITEVQEGMFLSLVFIPTDAAAAEAMGIMPFEIAGSLYLLEE